MRENLTDAEKRRFVEYLRNEQHDSEQLLKQAAKLSSGAMLQHLKLRVAAHRFVADRLESWESQTLGGEAGT